MIEVHFLHPRSSSSLTADIDPRCTGGEAIQELLRDDGQGRFIEPVLTGEHYELVIRRTGGKIAPDMTFKQAGVVDGDTIAILLAGQGACLASSCSAQSKSKAEMVSTLILIR